MIISASRRTDIPAFYSEWFMNRIREGYLYNVNPFNAHQFKRIELGSDYVDAIVFWTKNPEPLIKHLDELDQRGYRYYFQYTLTGYGKDFESGVPIKEKSIDTFKKLSEKIGSQKMIWRYDPIILSDKTSIDFHENNVESIARQLSGYTGRIVISFLDIYKKIVRRLQYLEDEKNIHIEDINNKQEIILRLSKIIKDIAINNQYDVFSCAEAIDLSSVGIEHGKCIDCDFINAAFGCNLRFDKDKHQRAECGCVESVDIGMYNTCKHNCEYCYANSSKKVIANNCNLHDDNSPTLVGNVELEEKEQLNLL
jgi:DNA repair photolyase